MSPLPEINPPLLNTACLWASNKADLEALYTSPHTGAITTRTACHITDKFPEDSAVHRHTFLSPIKGVLEPHSLSLTNAGTTHPAKPIEEDASKVSSLNTYGYATLSLSQYVDVILELEKNYPDIKKPVIFSVTGDSQIVAQCWIMLSKHYRPARPWCMEINLGCPNIPGHPPPAYSKSQLFQFLAELREQILSHVTESASSSNLQNDEDKTSQDSPFSRLGMPLGLKLPPYTYSGQFDDVVDVITQFNHGGIAVRSSTLTNDVNGTTKRYQDPTSNPHSSRDQTFIPHDHAIQNKGFTAPWPIAFVTATNTLGSSMFMEQTEDGWKSALRSDPSDSTSGTGGLAGAAIHALALGNVANLRKRLPDDIKIIGVGGVSDQSGMQRMKAAGADVVGLATALGLHGAAIFEEILSAGPTE